MAAVVAAGAAILSAYLTDQHADSNQRKAIVAQARESQVTFLREQRQVAYAAFNKDDDLYRVALDNYAIQVVSNLQTHTSPLPATPQNVINLASEMDADLGNLEIIGASEVTKTAKVVASGLGDFYNLVVNAEQRYTHTRAPIAVVNQIEKTREKLDGTIAANEDMFAAAARSDLAGLN